MTDQSKEKIAEALKRAIRSEELGFKFYDQIAQRTENPAAKAKLESLRDDEVRHRKTLLAMFENLVGGEVGELPPEGVSPLAKAFRAGNLRPDANEMELIGLAMEAEQTTAHYYEEQRDASDEDSVKAIFDRLAEEEHSHYELLQAERDALTGSYHWFSTMEGGSPMEH